MQSAIEYREFPASPALARYIESFWTIRVFEDIDAHAVLPDGCADILFSNGASRPDLRVVGGMTVVRRDPLWRGQKLFGVRFRPAMSSLFLKAPWPELTDNVIGLDEIVNGRAKGLFERLGEAASVREMIGATESWLGRPGEETVVQRVAEFIARERGQGRIEDLSRAAGISARQLRRLFVEQTGLTPKELARILRFRSSVKRLQTAGSAAHADLALECGFYDQAHFINEFRAFSGSTPGEYLALAL